MWQFNFNHGQSFISVGSPCKVHLHCALKKSKTSTVTACFIFSRWDSSDTDTRMPSTFTSWTYNTWVTVTSHHENRLDMTLVQVSINLCRCLYSGKYPNFTSCVFKINADYIIFVTGSWTWVIADTSLHESLHLKFSSGQKVFPKSLV